MRPTSRAAPGPLDPRDRAGSLRAWRPPTRGLRSPSNCQEIVKATRSVAITLPRDRQTLARTVGLGTVRAMSTEESLRSIGHLAIQLQPQVNFRDGAIDGAEVLARWRTPEGRMLCPAEFLPLLDIDWTHPMFGRQLVALAIDAQAQLSATGRSTRLWINLVPSMLETTEWLQPWLIEPCRDAGVPVSSFGFELTETALLKSFDDAREVLATLQSLGSHVALDDFGTGFSSLSHLRALPASVVKIDKSFVATVDQQLNESAIIGAVADLSHTLGMSVLCEGVETRWQAVAVANLGVDAAQGYLFGRPVDVADFSVQPWGGVDPIETVGFSMRRAAHDGPAWSCRQRQSRPPTSCRCRRSR